MKKLLLFSIISFFVLGYSCHNKSYAQKPHEQLPKAVKTSFKAKYPNEKDEPKVP